MKLRTITILFGILITALILNQRVTPNRKLAFSENYDAGRISKKWDTRGLCCSHSMQLVPYPTRSGNFAAQYKIHYDDPIVYNGKRSEIVNWGLSGIGRILGPDDWFGFSIFLPPDFEYANTKDILFQWHARPDKREIHRYPPMNLGTYRGNWRVQTAYSSIRIQKNSERAKPITIFESPYKTGKWTDWVFNVKWDYREKKDGGKGYVKIWQREEGEEWKKVKHYKGPNCYNDEREIDFQWGAYGQPWRKCSKDDVLSTCSPSKIKTRVVYNDELRVARSGPYSKRFDSVAPREFDKRNSAPLNYEYHWLEAEYPKRKTDSPNQTLELIVSQKYSNKGAMKITKSPGENNDQDDEPAGVSMDYEINIEQTGTYYVWARHKAENYKKDILKVKINGDTDDFKRLTTSFKSEWIWSRNTNSAVVAYFNISKSGKRRVSVLMSGSGTEFDKLLITNDPFYIPEGLGESAENFPK